MQKIIKTDSHPSSGNEQGYILMIVTLMGLVLAIILGTILPQLHMGQEVRAITTLNEYRAYEAARTGIEAVKLGLKDFDTANDTLEDNLLDYPPNATNSTILDAIDLTCGATANATNHFEYKDPEGADFVFVSGCKGINQGGADFGQIDVAVLVYDSNHIEGDPQTIDNSVSVYYSNNGAPFQLGTGTPFEYPDGNEIRYCDFDGLMTGAGNYGEHADFKYKRTSGGENNDDNDWSLSIGNNGTWRGRLPDNVTELWNFQQNISFSGILDQDGDQLKIIVIVRSRGITVAPGGTYDDPDKTDLMLLGDAPGSHLPNPAPQIIEAGFYLVESGGGLTVQRFYFAQAHNLED